MPLYLNSHQNGQNMAESRGDGEKTSQDCWNLMTRAEKVLLFLVILLLILLLGLSAFIVNHFLNEKNCDTNECMEASYKLLKTIDINTDPCLNFHKFVCGSGIPVREEQKTDLVISDFEEDDSPPLKTVKKFYHACTNETAIEEDNESTLYTLIKQIGGWPLLMGSEWKEESFNWQRYMIELRNYGLRSDWLLSFDYHEENGTNLLLMKPPKLEFKTRAYYYKIIEKVATKLGGPAPNEEQLNQLIIFEKNLSAISSHAQKELLEKSDYKNIVVSKMNKLFPENSLADVLNGLARGFSVFTNSTVVVIVSQKYLFELKQLLVRVPKRTQANYFVWKTVETFLPYCSNDIRDVYDKYVNIGNREEHCHSETIRRFYSVIEEEYVRKYESEKTLPLLRSIVNLTYQSYKGNKNASAIVVIEGPHGENSGVTINNLVSDKTIRMITEIQKHVENQFYHCLHRPPGCVKEGYYEDTIQFNPYFNPSENTIYLPYNLVYSDAFMWDQPNYINFAKIGRIIGDKIIEAEEEKYNTTINKLGVNLAYEGYIKWVQSNGMDKKLPVLDYNVKQLFWIYSSSMYCSKDDLGKFEEVYQSHYFKRDFECL